MPVQQQLFFVQRFKGKVLFGVPMRDCTSLRVGGPADVMAFPQDESDLKDLMNFASSRRFPLYILGSGTNLLVRDGGVRGIVVNMTEGFNEINWRDEVSAVAGAGVKLAALVSECAQRGLKGLEFASGIPGTVGGAAVMNAGAYGHEMKEVIEGVEIMTRKGKRGFIPGSEIDFSYRSAGFTEGSVVTRVHLSFEKGTAEEVRESVAEFARRRKSTSSINLPSAGSIFKNPEGKVAGKLIEEAGLKGIARGGAAVSEVHANYIVNRGGARAADVLSLMALIRDRVYKGTGIVLEPEIKVIGED
ncbi:MAG: UDP-N-acetylmuramate dehydrogenase [Thermodesulfobacteriota bacterium]|nr:MAG: UDP-N-acetylmuramate dehydrogenase [Thermodesulfobacteriota bacterium]